MESIWQTWKLYGPTTLCRALKYHICPIYFRTLKLSNLKIVSSKILQSGSFGRKIQAKNGRALNLSNLTHSALIVSLCVGSRGSTAALGASRRVAGLLYEGVH